MISSQKTNQKVISTSKKITVITPLPSSSFILPKVKISKQGFVAEIHSKIIYTSMLPKVQ